jgi:hypothetical protein
MTLVKILFVVGKKTKDAIALSVLLHGLRYDPHYTAFVREYANTANNIQ